MACCDAKYALFAHLYIIKLAKEHVGEVQLNLQTSIDKQRFPQPDILVSEMAQHCAT